MAPRLDDDARVLVSSDVVTVGVTPTRCRGAAASSGVSTATPGAGVESSTCPQAAGRPHRGVAAAVGSRDKSWLAQACVCPFTGIGRPASRARYARVVRQLDGTAAVTVTWDQLPGVVNVGELIIAVASAQGQAARCPC